MKIVGNLTRGGFQKRLAKLLGQRIHALASRAEPDEARLHLGPDDFLVESPLESAFDQTRLAMWTPSDAVVGPFLGELGKHA